MTQVSNLQGMRKRDSSHLGCGSSEKREIMLEVPNRTSISTTSPGPVVGEGKETEQLN